MANSWTPSQQAAMNLRGKDLLVSAAAGSGKTSVLTERIIRSLLDPENPADLSRMLIVTFTRAAAAELKGKIAEALGKALAEDPDNPVLSRQIFLLGSAQISTIDAFFLKAVKANFDQLNLPATFRVADEKELFLLKNEVLSSLLGEFYKRYDQESDAPLSVKSISKNDFARVLDHLMSGRSDGKLWETLLDFYECFSSDPLGIDRLKVCADEILGNAEKDYFESSFGKEVKKYLNECFSAYEKSLCSVYEHLDAAPDMALKYTDVVHSDLDFCRRITQAATYREAHEYALSFRVHDLPRGKIQKTSEIIAYQTRRAGFKSSIAQACTLLKTPVEVIPTQMRETAFALSMLHAFFKEYNEQLLQKKRERGAFEYNDIRAMLFSLLNTEDGKATPFAQSLAKEYDAVYIDEYQDVDLIQDRIFYRLGKGKRFMVGDIKQSIYGFRGSDPSLFSGYRKAFPLHTDEEANDADGVCVFMSNNFRCNDAVIKFANRVCAFLFSACEESIDYRPEDDLVFTKKMPESLPEGHPHPVSFSVFSPKKKSASAEGDEDDAEELSDEAIWTAAEISRLLREGRLDNGDPIAPKDIAILTQTRRPWEAYIKALAQLNIPASASLGSDLLYDPILTATLNLLRAVDNPYRDLPMTEFLLSEFGGFTLSELTELRDAVSPERAMYDALVEGAMGKGELAKKAAAVLSRLEGLRRNAAAQPADKFLRLLFLDEQFVPYANEPALLFLYDQARAAQHVSFQGIYEFLSSFTRLLENGKVSADAFKPTQSAITLMTVHHSKGLEFPVVFVCSSGTQFNKDDLKQTLLYHKDLGAATKLYNRESGNVETTAMHDTVKLRIDLEGTEEHIRTLYVALTRARERLYVTGTIGGKWENALASASEITYKNRTAILGSSTTLKWMLAAMQGAPEDFPCILKYYPEGTVSTGIEWDGTLHAPALIKEAGTAQGISPDAKKATDTPSDGDESEEIARYYANVKKRIADFKYPDQLPDGIPAKLAASKLHRGILDKLVNAKEDEAAIEAQIELMASAPSFDTILKPGHATAADIGSAMHAFLEFCDFESLYRNGVEKECERLLENRFLSADSVKLLNLPLLEKFRESDLMHLILDAESYRREQTFGIFMPMKELALEEALSRRVESQRIYVQGSIDLILHMKDGRLLLIDYKTDRMTDEEKATPETYRERLRAAHRDQLDCYSRAMKILFNKAPDDVRIYSIPLGETVRVYNKD